MASRRLCSGTTPTSSSSSSSSNNSNSSSSNSSSIVIIIIIISIIIIYIYMYAEREREIAINNIMNTRIKSSSKNNSRRSCSGTTPTSRSDFGIFRPRIFESKVRNPCAKKLDGALRKPTSFV